MRALRDWVNPASIRLFSLCLALAGLAMGMASCSGASNSTPFHTTSGVLPQTSSSQTPGTQGPTASPGLAATHDGTYSGVSTVQFSGGGRCMGKQKIVGFEVRGNRAEWAGLRGTIDANGGVQMHRGLESLTGQFEGGRFAGQLETGAWSSRPSCVYMFTLARVGP
jgi:hypothetical protein